MMFPRGRDISMLPVGKQDDAAAQANDTRSPTSKSKMKTFPYNDESVGYFNYNHRRKLSTESREANNENDSHQCDNKQHNHRQQKPVSTTSRSNCDRWTPIKINKMATKQQTRGSGRRAATSRRPTAIGYLLLLALATALLLLFTTGSQNLLAEASGSNSAARANLFGSRLHDDVDSSSYASANDRPAANQAPQRDARSFLANERLDVGESAALNVNGNANVNLDDTDYVNAEQTDPNGQSGWLNINHFANRQGQLLPPPPLPVPLPQSSAAGNSASGADPQRRPVRQPQAQQPSSHRQQQQQFNGPPQQPLRPTRPQPQQQPQQQQQFNGQDPFRSSAQPAGQPTGELPTPRFQRLRTPPGGNDQFLGNGLGRQPQANQQLGVPTLSAFELSSLANLANQAAGQQQANQQQAAFRRLQQQQPQQQQQQQQRGANNNNNNPINNQVPNNNNNNQFNNQQPNGFNGFTGIAPQFATGPQTELPFIRQVFRPAPQQEGPNGQPLLAGLPILQNEPSANPQDQEQSGPNQQPNERDLINLNNNNNNNNLRPTPPPLFAPPRPLSGQNGPKVSRVVEGGFTGINPAPAPLGGREVFFEPTGTRDDPPQVARARRPQAQLPANRPQPASLPANSEQQDPTRRRAPAPRRPSQRPQVPQATSGLQQQQQQQAQRPPAPAQDVVRLATSAIQTANEGLAVIGFPGLNPNGNADQLGGGFTSVRQPVELQQPATATTTTTASSPTTQTSTNSNTTPASTTDFSPTTTLPQDSQAGSSRRAAPVPLRNGASFLSLTSAATASPVTPFSPALPINAAMAASGGRRRIPVRTQVRLGGSLQQQPTTTSATPVAAAATTTTSSSSQSNGPVTTVSNRGANSVRRPEIEEFYETIGGGSSSSSIDGFGASSRSSSSSSSTTTPTTAPVSTTNASGEPSDRAPTTLAGDFYGSRLNGNEGLEPQQPLMRRVPAQQTAPSAPSQAPQQVDSAQGGPQPQPQPQAENPNNNVNSPNPVMVPVTYMTTLTYLTTVLHGTHTLETSHESIVRSTQLAALNQQLMDQIEHRRPLIEPTATISLSSKTKGRGTTLVNLKSAVSAYNQELVEALGVQSTPTSVSATSGVQPTSLPAMPAANRLREQQQQQQLQQIARPTKTVELAELQDARKSLLTEYVYLYTMRPLAAADGQEAPTVTSTRSELVAGSASVNGNEVLGQLGAGAQLIDSNGLLRLPEVEGGIGGVALNLGSTIGKDGLAVTEVNLNVNTYIKFDGITNALVDVKPTQRFPGGSSEQPPPLSTPSGARRPQELDTSFNVHLTLGNALDQLTGGSSSNSNIISSNQQQTPALDSAATTRQPIDLLRATGGASATTSAEGQQQQAAATRLATSNSRASARLRIASSRFRTAPGSALAASPRVGASGSAVLSSSPSAIESNGQVAPSSSGIQRGIRPTKSRLLRPSLLKSSLASEQPAANEQAAAATSSPVVQPTRQTKPRFVVVTRTGQFGIRASAISSAAAAAASSAAANELNAVTSEQPAPSATQQQLLRPSSKFVNRFQKSRASASQAAASQSVEPTATNPLQASRLADLDSGLGTPTLPPFDSSDIRRPVGSSTTSTTSQPPSAQADGATSGSGANNAAAGPEANLPLGVQLDGSSSVVVTYYTTTTHTIPFVMSSQTIFTTLEETNTRTATEHVKDLGSHFIKPTASLNSRLPQIQATARPEDATLTTQQLGEQSAPTTNQPPAGTQANGSGQQNGPQIDPSFVVSLNTRTLFTTFTFFTTFAAGGSATPTVVSSESTTSQIVTETVTSVYEQTQASDSPTAVFGQPDRSSSILSSMATSETIQSSSVAADAIQPTAPITQTLVSTMTYYGTVYNGTQTSLTPIVDVSTQLLTLTSPGFNVNSDVLAANGEASSSIAPTQAPAETQTQSQTQTASDSNQQTQTISLQDSSVQPTQMTNDPNKVTRTRSLYTTLTHFITFYSGTKTQLSTIQEISPTVVTEYIDKTLFEQQQQEAAAASSSVVVVPPNESSINMPVMTLTPSPVLPMMTATSGIATTSSSDSGSTGVSSSESEFGDNQPSGSSTSTTTAATTTTTTTTSTTTTTPRPELESAQASKPNGGAISSDNQSADARVLPSTDENGAATPNPNDGKSSTNIIELSDLIAANSSQSGRVALAGNLGAAIKDIVQLLAGNKTNTIGPLSGLQSTPELPPVESDGVPQTTTTTGTSTTSTTNTTPVAPRQRTPTRVFGNKAKEQQQQQQQQLQNLQGSMTSPSIVSTSVLPNDSPQSSVQARATPDLVSSSAKPSQQQQQQQPPAATIFFGDDGGDERKKQVKTAWPGAQSTVYLTSIEPSTRLLTLTTTKVYYTRDAPLTITSSYTTVIAPRTFVSTIMGTRTLVNQLNTQLAPVELAKTTAKPATAAPVEQQKPTQPSRQESAASGHRLTAQLKQQKQQAQEEAVQRKVKAQEQAKREQQAAIAAAKQKAIAAAAAAAAKGDMGQNANINQCQPMCKLSNNEICKFTPNSDTIGAQGTFSCACRPGYHMMINSVGQRQCQEVQSYVVLLRLLQIGDQPVSFKRELQDRSSPEYKQYSRVIKDHVKRAYMTSELTRDRFVNADIINYARSLSSQPGASSATSSASAQPTGGKQPIAVSKLDPLNAGLIVNITVQLQPPAANANEILDENTLKEELTKKLNMRQAAALAAAAAAAANGGAKPETEVAVPSADGNSTSVANSTSSAANATMELEMLPNPNALFLADVEQVTDLDECANPALNDCHEGAVCINEVGSYKCDCREYPDLNPLHPGRQCASELKSCDYCNNRGDCIRVPSVLPPTSVLPSSAHNSSSSSSSSQQLPLGNGRGQAFSTVCQCHRIYLGRRCEINGLLLATLLPIVAILLIISVCLAVYCCRRWRKRSALSKGFRNIGTFGPNMIGGTLDRKAMLESSSESSDTHQRTHHHHHHLRNAANGIYDTHGGLPSDPSSSNESSPRQMVRSDNLLQGIGPAGYHLSPHLVEGRQQAQAAPPQAQSQPNSSLGPYCNSIPPQIVIPRARHNQVNYAVHRGQVYMW